MNKKKQEPKYLDTYSPLSLVELNPFKNSTIEKKPLPQFNQSKSLLPQPFWQGHEDAIALWWKTWELAFKNLRRPNPQNGFVSNYIDTAFNNNLFLWDSVFILMFGRYGIRCFDFQKTLDNLYCKQHPDGFICREIREKDGTDMFHRHDPTSTGPNIFAWSEWEYFLNRGDIDRLSRVFPVILGYHLWHQKYRSWPEGGYWSSGWGCGMDNQPRLQPQFQEHNEHGRMVWVDASFQAVLSAKLLLQMAETLRVHKPNDTAVAKILHHPTWLKSLSSDVLSLEQYINNKLWSDHDSYFYDLWPEQTLNQVKSIGAFWGLLADSIPAERISKFIAHLEDPLQFNRPHRVPTLSADHPAYQADGGYWKGSVWPPTNYMVLRGLTRVGKDQLAWDIAWNHYNQVLEIFSKTGTVFENYSPEKTSPGNPAKSDFVGWGGVPPIAVFLEYILGLRPDVPQNTLLWDVRLLEEHGVNQYPFGNGNVLSLLCKKRSSAAEKPVIIAQSEKPITLLVRWSGGEEKMTIQRKP